MSRYRAALIHFALSALVVGSVFLVVYFFWYPRPLFERAGGLELFLVLALVDVTIGPLITLVIFKSGKWGLKFDLTVIALMQVAALAYGVHVVHQARPVWIVFVKDRFEVVRANYVVDHAKGKPPFDELSLTGPRIAGAIPPTEPDEQFRILMTAASGFDVQSYPQFYVPYEQVRGEAAAKGKPLSELRRLNAADVGRIDAAIRALGRTDAQVRFLPVRAGKRDLVMFIDASSGEILQLAPFEAWAY